VVDVDGNHRVRKSLQQQIAAALQRRFYSTYESCHRALQGCSEQVNAETVALRSLKNRALSYLMLTDDPESLELCRRQFDQGGNMTDVFAALTALTLSERPDVEMVREEALNRFYQRWQHEPLVVNQWLAVQASSPVIGDLARIETLRRSAAFDSRNPNKVRSLVGVFCNQNLVHFHSPTGSGVCIPGG
jgi:Aminopeptidase N